jgi:hypothetical protein
MAWNPKIDVFDETKVKENLESYISQNQADALIWANDGTALPVIQKFYSSRQLVTIFPALTFLQTFHRSDFEDTVGTDFGMVLECSIVHGNQSELAKRAPRYSKALESMLVNMPADELLKGSSIEAPAYALTLEITFDVQGKYKNQYIDVFQCRAGWKITKSAYL